MISQRSNQRGFAMAAMFIAVLAAGLVSLNVKTKDGITVANAIGIDFGKQTEFSTFEADSIESQ
ncbi:hypothetical protein DFR30_0960 [Thiogranum longum]|uniref:Uncharacterized protein n=1 Tax=Thiogranum longum TaxID=1537524 RepID=A0A4R1H8Y4_9GAMM|nr:hypothetical protein [Thiogranum longum]TCK17718.1 hypothetical protein DFR30_0960 [Thiogranum longum]